MTVNSRGSSLGCKVSRMTAAARKPVGSFPKSSTARRVGRAWAKGVVGSSSRQSDNTGSRFRSFMNKKIEQMTSVFRESSCDFVDGLHRADTRDGVSTGSGGDRVAADSKDR